MKDESGFTLIEVLVAALIVVMLFTASFTILESGMRSWLRGEDRADRQQNVRIVMDRLTREIRQAKAVLDVGTYVNGNKFVQFQDAGDRTVKYLFDEEKKRSAVMLTAAGVPLSGMLLPPPSSNWMRQKNCWK